MMAERGELTEAVRDKIERFMERSTTTQELRLMPYIQYQMMNEQRIDPTVLNEVNREILSLWREAGHIKGGMSGLAITREFWDFINDVLFDAYAAYREA